MAYKLNKKKAVIAAFTILLLIILGAGTGYVSYIYYNSKAYNNLILPGVSVKGIDLSGMNREEAFDIINQQYGDVTLKRKIDIIAPSKTYTVEYSKLNAKYNVAELIDEAYGYGRNLNMFNKYKFIKNPVNKEFKLALTYDPKPVKDLVENMRKDIDKLPINASISLIGTNKFSVTPERKGAKLQTDVLEKQILDKINEDNLGNIVLKAPVEEVQPTVSADKLASVNTRLASFSTDFSTSSEERANNITLATRAVNGTVLLPGETFSFNEIVGERTLERGYKEAPVIIGNKIDSGLGGGICQVSSTLYNAVLKSNIKSTERIHHTLASSYVGLGMDATVDWGNIDYKFKNTLPYPVYIEGYTHNRVLYFNVYSNSDLTKRTYEIVNEVYQTIPAKTKDVYDPTMPEGQVEIVQKAYNGARVKVYKNAYENGKLVDQELLYSDYYKEVEGIVKRGTKK